MIQNWDRNEHPLHAARTMLADFADLPVLDCGPLAHGRGRLRAIFGMTTTESSFKSILGFGILLLAYEKGLLRRGQTVIESTSGSLGVSLALAGRILGNPVELVTDGNIPAITRRKIELLGARLHFVAGPHPTGGTQQARVELLEELLAARPDLHWTNQNDSELNPATYRRWMVPRVAPKLDLSWIDAAIFVVGTGGHFVALSELLRANGIPCYVADRVGSATFGGKPGPSVLRGIGNQNTVPAVIGSAMHLVEDVYYSNDDEAAQGVRELAARGIYVGGTSGIAFRGATTLVEETTARNVLTFFPDRGDLYGDQFLGASPAEEAVRLAV
ncbi:pyridoxal-phosphate dependent enzyme [Actinophytocola oryzae]|uniref:Cysteine synthase A n=1 Tax=Actinophytocola oryzae TaxID=502181 RepID=A0A4R7UZP7_9PSEU|nr:pyridoxal-phosphate dependent enzyme [Actinophytocola oryzae]TDV41025.1 cysteine synthase A [Actinophytocola oryzae]